MNLDRLTDILIRHEGLRLKPYKDTVGKLTIGVGRNLDDNGITEEEARAMLETDLYTARAELFNFPWFAALNEVRQEALINMVFNLGITRFRRFKRMIAAIERGDWEGVAAEALDSRWATQVGQRAQDIAFALEHGEWA